MDENGTIHATCGSGDYGTSADGRGYRHRCDDPAPYRAEYRRLSGDGDDFTIPVCVRHAAIARTSDSLKRIYTAGAHVAADAD